MTEIVVKDIETEEAKEEIKNEVDEQEGTQNEEKQPEPEETKEEEEEKPKDDKKKNVQVMTKTDMNKLKQKNYSTRNQRNETVFCADCNKFMSKHNYRYNHLCQPLKEKKQQKTMVKTAIDPEQLKADIMRQLKEEMAQENQQKTAREKYATIKEEKNTQKREKIKSLASKIL